MGNDAFEYSVVVRCGGATGVWLSATWPQDSRGAEAHEMRRAEVRAARRELRRPMLSWLERNDKGGRGPGATGEIA